MSRMTTVGRRGIVAVFAATVITTAACGTDTGTDTGTDKGTDVENSVPYAPGAVAPVVPEPGPGSGTSADAAERRGAEQATPVTPKEKVPGPHGMRIPD